MFQEVLKEHDREFNPSGVPWKSKRPASDTPDVQKESLAVSVPPVADIPNKTALSEKMPFQEVLGKLPFFEMLITGEGELWIHGKGDGIIDRVEPLFLLHGKFMVGQSANALMAEGGSQPATCKRVALCFMAWGSGAC